MSSIPNRIPGWLKRRLPEGRDFFSTKALLAGHRLNTICEDAKCPNIWECWSRKTATFLILGDVCTRRCGFCAVAKGRPQPPDPGEPQRLARAVMDLGLRYVVVTSVDRDDLPDQGAGHFRDVISAIRNLCPGAHVEILTPDFRGQVSCLDIIFRDARPDVFSHNVETVPRLYAGARRGSDYARSLGLLKAAKKLCPDMPVKSGLMLGLGETREETLQTLRDLRAHDVDILTVGQYLKPSQTSLDVVVFHPPEHFRALEQDALGMGFKAVRSGPMVRSSYHADEMSGLSMATL